MVGRAGGAAVAGRQLSGSCPDSRARQAPPHPDHIKRKDTDRGGGYQYEGNDLDSIHVGVKPSKWRVRNRRTCPQIRQP